MSNQTLSDHACAPAPYLPLAEDSSAPQPRRASSAVIATSDKLWDIGYQNDKLTDRTGADVGTVVLLYGFLPTPGAANIPEKQQAVRETIKTWEEHCNVRFVEQTDAKESADIRIKFAPSGGSWSVVGKTLPPYEIDNKAPTLNLGWLSGHPTPDEKEKGTILHEFGHALGMMHEHQSPARGEKITLKTEEVYKYYLPLLHFDRNLVKSQVVDVYDSTKSNFSHFDQTSIMMYFMPGRLNYENVDVEVNVKLSELDKAYVGMTYPSNDLAKLIFAMGIIGIPDKDASYIIDTVHKEKDKVTKEDLNQVRERFFEYNKANIEAAALLRAKEKSMLQKQHSIGSDPMWASGTANANANGNDAVAALMYSLAQGGKPGIRPASGK